LSQSFKICPICDTPAHRNAAVCSTCGTTLTNVQVISVESQKAPQTLEYDHRYGETDLLEANLRWRGGTYILGVTITLAVLICISTVLFFGFQFAGRFTTSGFNAGFVTITTVPTQPGGLIATVSSPAADLVTNTPRPTVVLVTVTPAPPTPTITDTPGPCMQQVAPGDDLISIVSRCGHRNLDIIDLVLEINDMSDPSMLQAGQTLEIPWPTPTDDPNAEATEESTSDVNAQGESAGIVAMIEDRADTSDIGTPTASPTATLQPGVMWHRVAPDENILIIAYNYGADIEILSQLNPEVTFSQCDFGEFTGGPGCIVQIYQGQLLRVPAPTPTPTLSPTPSGSETATPTPTATYNAPNALSPPDRALFQQDELITLRWVASGTLASGQVYRVRIEDQTTGAIYTSDTQELYFIVPSEWQAKDRERHILEWTVSVIDLAFPNDPRFTTERRTFTWMGRGESE
jgi:hypothetical protein